MDKQARDNVQVYPHKSPCAKRNSQMQNNTVTAGYRKDLRVSIARRVFVNEPSETTNLNAESTRVIYLLVINKFAYRDIRLEYFSVARGKILLDY